MSDHFTVEPAQVKSLAQAIAARQDVPSEQGARAVEGAAGIDTGDPSVDGQVRATVDGFKDLLAEVTRKLTYTSQWVTRIAEDYEDTDDEVGSGLDEIDPNDATTGPTTAPQVSAGAPVTSSIAQILAPEG